MIEITKPSIPPYEEYIEEIKSIWENDWLTNFGPIEQKFTKEAADFLEVDNLSLFTNGHQALMAALNVMNFPKGGEVITTPFTFASTTHAIVGAGLTPVFADVDPVTYTLDPEKAEKLINEKTCCILPVHVYGNMCDTEGFDRLSEKYGIPVIYDAAHCFGVKKNGKGAGSFGKCSMFSFHATKAFNSIEGGALAYGDENLKLPLKQYTNFGLVDGENVDFTGTNAKMNEFSAAMGICNLRHIKDVLEQRKIIHNVYKNELFETDPDFDEKTGFSPRYGIKMLPTQENVERNYAYFPVIFDTDKGCRTDRDTIMSALKDNDIKSRRYFYPLTSEFSCYKELKGSDGTPVARDISSKVLALPMYALLTEEDAMRICGIIKEYII